MSSQFDNHISNLNNMNTRLKYLFGGLSSFWLGAALSAQADVLQISNADISGTVNWYSTNTYVLNGFVFVEDGETLNIEAGTVIKAKDGEGANISALVVARGGKLFAVGTASRPIIFTAEVDDVSDPNDLGIWDRGLWGGVVLMGKARINTASDASGNAAIPKYDVYEGIPSTNPNYSKFFFGGDNDEDSCGVLRYVSIRHGGKVLESNKEINGLSLCAVGRGTTIEFVECYAIKDDGFEFFGGTVNTRYLVSAFNDDDAFDADQGHTGKHQFWFGIQAPDVRDKGMELNGEPNGLAVSNAPLARFTVYNATIIGAGARSGGNNNSAFTIREYASPRIYNSIFTDFAQRGVSIDAKSKALLESGDLDLQDNIWWGFTDGNTPANLDLGNASLLWTDVARQNEITNPMLRSISRTNDFGLDPRLLVGSPGLSTDRSAPAGDSFLTTAPYKGAFDSTTLWISGWTALSQYQIIPPIGGRPSQVVQVSDASIQGTVNWYNTNTYVLNGFVFVEQGEVLNIEAGTVIKAKDGEGANISALVVARGGKIFASGTLLSPIIFTAEADDVNDPSDLGIWDRGLWGGIVLMGKARINTASDSAGNAASPKFDVYEGIPSTNPNYSKFFFGGDNDEDSCGVLRYVSIRHGGKVLESNKEINGLSLCAVGRGTTVEYVESYAIKDDGFEFFGGTVNTRYLVSAFNDDDAFDVDQGHSGKHQFWFGIQAPDVRDKGMELNGEPNGLAVSNAPLARFTVFNATIIGAGAGSGGNNNNAFTIREFSSPQLYNSIFTDFAQRGVSIDAKSKLLLDNGSLQLQDNIWWGFTDGNTAANLDLGNAAVLWTDSALQNDIVDPQLISIGRTNTLRLDPRPQFTSPALTTDRLPTADGFFTPASYKGAFRSVNWAAGWTALSDYGILTGMGAGEKEPTSTVENPLVVTVSLSSGSLRFALQSASGRSYQLQSSSGVVSPNWVDEGTAVGGTGAELLLSSAIGNDPSKFYRVTVR
jgi:hypothetical protein